MTNGEKYTTAKERAEAFRRYHDEHHHVCRDTPYVGDAINKCVMCLFNWLDHEAPADEPLPCPFCGASVMIVDRNLNLKWQVECPIVDCKYTSGQCETEDAAIAAHNRVARAAKGKEAK